MNWICRKNLVLAATLATAFTAGNANAGGTITFGEDKSITVGFGIRTSFTTVDGGAPNGKSRSADFNLDSIRLFTSGSLNKYIKGTFNTEKDGNGGVNVLDAYAQFEIMPEFNIWAGRMLPPSDRANLDGPYYLNAYEYPGVVSQYPAKFAGRDNGVTLWGKLFDKHLVYSVGIFEGHNKVANASNDSDNLLYTGRVQYDFWDAGLDPAYYTSSTYYGKDVLSLALVGMYQKDGVGTSLNKGDYKAWNVDLLFEKVLGEAGVLTLEGAYYQYNTSGKIDTTAAAVNAGSTDNVGGLVQGDAYLAAAAYLIPYKVGWGKFQPNFRYQHFDADAFTGVADQTQYDIGTHYVIDGHNARISATYTKNEVANAKDTDKFMMALQLQF